MAIFSDPPQMRSGPRSSLRSIPDKGVLIRVWLTVLVLAMVAVGFSSAVAEEAAAAYFSETYHEARLKFIAAATEAGGTLRQHRNPHQGAEGEALYTDVAAFNVSHAKSILVVGSGTHGVEGFAGSAIQVGLLRAGIAEQLPDGVGLLFYHALNPYGFSHLRRFNEDNVDLNRNFVEHHLPHPSNEDYDALAWVLEPDSLSRWTDLKAKMGIAWYRVTEGTRWLQSAISRGQYHHPKGLFFGGTAETWSNRTLKTIAAQHLSQASRVIFIDVHTGLGKYGAAEAITESHPSTSQYQWMQRCWDIPITYPHSGDAISPRVYGPLKHGFARLLPNTEVIAASLEFGTYPASKVLWALRAENHLHHHGDHKSLDAAEIKAELKRMFYPQNADWERTIWQQGSAMALQTLDCLR